MKELGKKKTFTWQPCVVGSEAARWAECWCVCSFGLDVAQCTMRLKGSRRENDASFGSQALLLCCGEQVVLKITHYGGR